MQKEFRVLRVQFSKAELAVGDSEQLRCSTLDPLPLSRKRPKLFDTGLVCDCFGFVPVPKVFCFFFAMFLKIDFRVG